MITEEFLLDEVEVGDLLDDGAAQTGEVLEVVVRVWLLALDHAEVELLRWSVLFLPENDNKGNKKYYVCGVSA